MMNSNFLIGIEAIRPVCIKAEVGQDPEFIWIATHKDYDWFCGYGRNSVSAINRLEKLIKIVEQHTNRDDQVYSVMKAQFVEE